MYKVIFEGFENKEQAIAFANWYSGSGEQHSGIWLEEHSDATDAMVDTEKLFEIGGFNTNINNEVIVPLTIYKDEN